MLGLGFRYVDDSKDLPEKCQGCLWRRGRVCMFASCVQSYMAVAKDGAIDAIAKNAIPKVLVHNATVKALESPEQQVLADDLQTFESDQSA